MYAGSYTTLRACGLLLVILFTQMPHEGVLLAVTTLLVYSSAIYPQGMTSKYGLGGRLVGRPYQYTSGPAGLGICQSLNTYQASSDSDNIVVISQLENSPQYITQGVSFNFIL